MSNGYLLIRYHSDDCSNWSWISVDKEYHPVGEVESGDLNALAKHAEDNRVILLIAGRSLLITTVDVPRGNRRTLTSAIPYALEEQLAEDIELIHCASAERQEDGSIPVVAVAKSFLTELLQLLSSTEVYPVKIIAEPLLLPWHDDGLSILIRDDTAIVRTGAVSGFESPLDQLPLLLTSLQKERGSNHRYTEILVWSRQGEESDIYPLLENLSDQITLEHTYSDLRLLIGSKLKRPTINLLSGFHAPNSAQSMKSWWQAAAMLLLAVTIYTCTAGYRYYSINSQIAEFSQKSETLFRKSFPDVKRLIKSRLVEQARQQLDQRKRAHGQIRDDLLALLLTLGEVKQRHSTIELMHMEFRQNSLIVNLHGSSVAQIEQFKQQLDANKQTTSEILSAISKDQIVEARIKIQVEQT